MGSNSIKFPLFPTDKQLTDGLISVLSHLDWDEIKLLCEKCFKKECECLETVSDGVGE